MLYKTSAGLNGGEADALNESFGDIFGEMIERYNNSNNHDWSVGGGVGFGAQRPFAREVVPSTTQAQIYRGQGWDFNGEPHVNGGVQNRWFYLLSVGVAPSSGLNVPAIGEEKAARIAYRSLTRYLGSNSNYASARAGAIQAATDLYGACSTEVLATTNAWAAVGVGNTVPSNCASQITGRGSFCVEDGASVYAEYRLAASPQAIKTWSVDNASFVFSQSGQTDYAVLTQVPRFASTATLSVYVQFPNSTQNVWRYYYINTEICRPQPPYCPPGQICNETPQLQRAANQIDAAQNITAFPNPASTILTLELSAPTQTPATVSIRDLLGRTLRSQILPAGQQRISLDVANLPSGSFLVNVTTATTTTVKHFQVVR